MKTIKSLLCLVIVATVTADLRAASWFDFNRFSSAVSDYKWYILGGIGATGAFGYYWLKMRQIEQARKARQAVKRQANSITLQFADVPDVSITLLDNQDILKVPGVDAIVNAAKESCLGGGGIDRVIGNAGGNDLANACRALPIVRQPGDVRCPAGEARLTTAGGIPNAWYVIHAVGPDCSVGKEGFSTARQKLLVDAYVNSLRLIQAWNHDNAAGHPEFENVPEFVKRSCAKIRSVVFPSIGSGWYQCDVKVAAPLVARGIVDWLRANRDSGLEKISFAFYNPDPARQGNTQSFEEYQRAFRALALEPAPEQEVALVTAPGTTEPAGQ